MEFSVIYGDAQILHGETRDRSFFKYLAYAFFHGRDQVVGNGAANHFVDKLEAFAGGPQLLALTDIAVTPDNSRIFVSDVVLGILLIDPEARRSAMLSGPETLNLSGIYGIEYEDGNVIVTQSGLSPQRLMRLKISANGADVETVLPMASSLDGFDTPGAGTLRDGNIYYFANHGSASADKLLLMKTPLTAGVESKPPDVRQFEEALRKASQQ